MKYVYQAGIGYISLKYLCENSQIIRPASTKHKEPAIEFIKLIEAHTIGSHAPTFVEDDFYVLLFDTEEVRDTILKSIVDAK